MADSRLDGRLKCFIAMPISTPAVYVEKYGDPEHFSHVLQHFFRPTLERLGYEVISPAVEGSQLIHAEIIRNLEQADLVLCDLSSLNPNVFFELGIRTSLDRPVVLVKDSLTTAIPFDLAAVNTATYNLPVTLWTVEAEITRLTAHIKSLTSADASGNAMWRYFGLTKRAAPSEAGANPIESKIDLLLSELAKLRPIAPGLAEEILPGDLLISRTSTRAARVRRFKDAVGPMLVDVGITEWSADYRPARNIMILNVHGFLEKETADTIIELAKEFSIWLEISYLPPKILS